MAKIKILIADDVAETRENIKRLLSLEQELVVIGQAKDGEEAVKQAEKLRPDVVLMDINMPVLDGIKATELISLRCPGAAVIIISVQGEQEYLKRAMMAGAREYLVKPFSGGELADTVRRVYDLERKRRVHQSSEEALSTVDQRQPQIITVFSTKGGVGKTTLAVNLAVSLYQETKGKVALVDLDLQFGDGAVMLNLLPKQTIAELVQEIHQLDGDMLENFLIPHPSGIKLLAAPTRPEYAELVTGAHVEKIVNLLKQNYDYVIIDTPPVFNETNLMALDMANQILLILALDLPTIKNIRLSLEVLDSLHHKGKTKMILNRASSEFGLKVEDVESSLNFLIASHVPSDGKVVVSSANRGIPFVQSQPASRSSQSLRELARLVIEDRGYQPELQNNQRRGLLGRFFG